MYVLWVRSKLEPNDLRQIDRLTERFIVLHFAAKNIAQCTCLFISHSLTHKLTNTIVFFALYHLK